MLSRPARPGHALGVAKPERGYLSIKTGLVRESAPQQSMIGPGFTLIPLSPWAKLALRARTHIECTAVIKYSKDCYVLQSYASPRLPPCPALLVSQLSPAPRCFCTSSSKMEASSVDEHAGASAENPPRSTEVSAKAGHELLSFINASDILPARLPHWQSWSLLHDLHPHIHDRQFVRPGIRQSLLPRASTKIKKSV